MSIAFACKKLVAQFAELSSSRPAAFILSAGAATGANRGVVRKAGG